MNDRTMLEIAQHLAMSERNAFDVLRALNIDKKTTSLDDIRTAYIKDLREKAAGRGSSEQQNAAIARTRKDNNAADLMEMQIAEKAGQLINVAKIEPFLTGLIIASRQQFLSFPKKWSQEIRAIHGLEIDELYFEDDINNALNELAVTEILESEDTGCN